MIKFKNVAGQSFLAVGTIQRKSALNGEKSLTGTIYDGDDVLNKIDKGWSLEFGDEPYVITYFERNDSDNTVSFDAIHRFFWNTAKSVLYTSTSGSHAIKWYLDQIFSNTGYTYALNYAPTAIGKDNWGMKTKLSLFNDIISSIGGEFEINGTLVSIFEKVGTDLSTIVRYGFNLSDMSVENDAVGFVTYGEGFGAYADQQNQKGDRLHVTYTSPLASVYGKLQAEPVDDQRFTIQSNLLNAVKDEVDGSFSVSIKLSLYDLTAAGYPYKMANVGDWLMAIDERLDFKQRIRIISIDDEFSAEGTRISYTVTAGNVGIVQKYQDSNASLATQVNNAMDAANQAVTDANVALIAANGKNTSYYVDSFDILPKTANEGDLGWVQTGDGRVLYIYTKKPDGSFYWEKRIDPEIGEQIAAGVEEAVLAAKSNSDNAIDANNVLTNQAIDSVSKANATALINAGDFNNKAQAMVDKGVADAKANTTTVASQTLATANANLTQAKTDLTTGIAKEATDRATAVSALDTKAQGYVNQAKTDVTATITALSVGGRNYVLSSSGENASNSNRPYVKGGNTAVVNATTSYGNYSIGLAYTGTGTQEWYYALVESYANVGDGPLVIGKTYTFSVDVKGTAPSVAFRISNIFSPSVTINNTDWTRLTYTGPLIDAGGTGKYYIRLNASNGTSTPGGFINGQIISFRHFKIEDGNLPSAWITAPEDIVQDYTNKDNVISQKLTQYQQSNDDVVGMVQSDITQVLGQISTKVSQNDYNIKTGQLQADLNTTSQTATQSKQDIVAIKQADSSQDARMNSIVADANGTKQTVSSIQTVQGQQSGSITTLQTRADGFDATVTKVNNLSVGGRNLLLGTEQFVGDLSRWQWVNTWDADPYNGHKTVQTGSTWGGPKYVINDLFNRKVVEPNTDYTLSVKVRNTSNASIDIYFFAPSIGITDRHIIKLSPNSDWTTISTTFQFSDINPNIEHGTMRFEPSSGIPSGQGTIIQTEMKFERGNIVTDWTPAPEDVDSATAKAQLTADTATLNLSNYQTSADGRITKAQSDIVITANQVQTKVSQSDYNAKTTDLTTKVSTAQQTADTANTTIGSYKTSNDGRVTTAETSIKANKDAISLTATKQDLNNATGSLNTSIGAVNVKADSVTTTVAQLSKDTTTKFATQQTTIDGISSTVSANAGNINSVTSRVQTAEGTLSTATNNISGLTTKQTTLAGQVSQEISDRQNGDSNTLNSAANYTSSQISNSETSMKSLINQKADSVVVGTIQGDVSALKSANNWQQISYDDLNFLKTQGNYLITGGKNINTPINNWFYITVDAPTSSRITQHIWKDLDATLSYFRTFDGTNWSAWVQQVSSSTLLSIFKDSWSLGTSINDGITNQMITGINGQPDGSLHLKGSSITLDGNTTVTGDFYALGGNFKNLNASNMTVGTLNGNQVNVTNINANNIVAGTISGANLSINLNTGQVYFQNGRIYSQSIDDQDGIGIDINIDKRYIATRSSLGYSTLKDGGLYLSQYSLTDSGSSPYFGVKNDTSGFGTGGALLYGTKSVGIATLPHSVPNYIGQENYNGIIVSEDKKLFLAGYSKGVMVTGGADIGNSAGSPFINLGTTSSNTVNGTGGDRISLYAKYLYLSLQWATTTSSSANMFIASDGAVVRSSSSSKYKLDIEYEKEPDTANKLLTLDPATWHDKFESEQIAKFHKTGVDTERSIDMNKRRYYGIIAEDLVKAGLDYLVQRSPETGDVEGVEYSKIGVALIPIVRELRNRIIEQNIALERLKEQLK